uniref:Uncharacterized protein n=1 Tax=Pararge aegeria TaxID=116150 RepID=S4PJY9_9NEOP
MWCRTTTNSMNQRLCDKQMWFDVKYEFYISMRFRLSQSSLFVKVKWSYHLVHSGSDRSVDKLKLYNKVDKVHFTLMEYLHHFIRRYGVDLSYCVTNFVPQYLFKFSHMLHFSLTTIR